MVPQRCQIHFYNFPDRFNRTDFSTEPAFDTGIINGQQISVFACHPLERAHRAENAPDPCFKVDSQANSDAHGDYPHGSEYITGGFRISPRYPEPRKHKSHHYYENKPAEPGGFVDWGNGAVKAYLGQHPLMKSTHRAEPAAVKSAPLAGENHE